MLESGGLRRIAHSTGMVGMTSPCGVGQLGQVTDSTNHRPLASDLANAAQKVLLMALNESGSSPRVEQATKTGTGS